MKTALDCYSRGKQKESSADEYMVSSYYSRERFICPECGEFVHLRRSKYSNYFAHYKRLDTSAECDRRVDGVPTDSIYEKIGLPIYIRHGVEKGTYELYLGFKALPKSIMDEAENNKIKLTIDRKGQYSVNRERFSTENTVLIPIHHIPHSEKKYNIMYSPTDKARHVIKHWSDYADGFSNNGSLFTISDQGGRKIRHGDSISTDVDYYWVKRDKYIPSSYQGIQMEEQGRLILENFRWYVFKVCFSSNISDRGFERLATYLRETLHLYLLEKEPKYVPIWPPLIKQEDEYLVESDKRKIYGCIMSGNDEPKTYIYQGVNSVPTEVMQKGKLLRLSVDSSDFLVNIDRKYISGGTKFSRSAYDLESAEPLMNVISNLNDFRIENQIIELNDIPEKINGIDNKMLVVINAAGGIQVIDNQKMAFDLSDLRLGDTIYILSATYLKSIIRIIKDEVIGSSLDEECVIQKMELCRYSNKVFLPNRLKAKIIKVSWENKKIQVYMDECLRSNKIPMPMIRLLEGMLNENV